MKRSPKISAMSLATVLLVASSTVALGLTVRHDAWEGVVVGKDGSKVKGPVSMVPGMAAGTTELEVSFTGDVAGTTRPWHVHVGSCAKRGAVLGDAKAYTPLTVGSSGAAQGKATLRLAWPEGGNYYVNIHESAANMGKIVACGDLFLEE